LGESDGRKEEGDRQNGKELNSQKVLLSVIKDIALALIGSKYFSLFMGQ
jgi:hypothetical protein